MSRKMSRRDFMKLLTAALRRSGASILWAGSHARNDYPNSGGY